MTECKTLADYRLPNTGFSVVSFAPLRHNCPQRSTWMKLRRNGLRFWYAGRFDEVEMIGMRRKPEP